jgi:putative ABC transport system permease protein
MMQPNTRPPLLARMLASRIVGPDAEILRGDLEESYRRRLTNEGASLRLRLAGVADAASSLLRWWWYHKTHRSHVRSVSDRGEGKMATLGPDLRQMFRGLLRRPGYAGMVALTLGLGIGATTTIYSVVDAMLVRPLPYRDSDRLVIIGNTTPGREMMEGREGLYRIQDIALPNFGDLRAWVRGIEASAAIERRNWLFTSPENVPEVLDVANVEAGFFDLLTVTPFLGRLPREGDQPAPGGGTVGAVISYAGWQKRFGADPNVVGKTYGFFTILGVLPRHFVQPAALVGTDVEFWTHLDPNDRRYTDRRRPTVKILARLDAGAPLARVRRDLSAAQTRLAAEQPTGNTSRDGGALGAGVNSLRDATVGAGQRSVLIFLGAALLLLVLAGTNAANLIIVRGLERDGELSLRRALGAARSRLAANLVAESVSLALAGGIIGLGIAVAGVGAFRRFGPQSLPRMSEVGVNVRIIVAGVLLSILVGLLVGLIPAIRFSGADLLANLRSSLTAFSPRGTRLRTSLAATQLALALILGIGASLLFRSFLNLRTQRLGFDPQHLVAFSVAFKKQRPWESWDEVFTTVSALPGVTAVAGASNLPFQSPGLSLRLAPADQPANAAIAGVAVFSVSPAYFETARIPVIRGRSFNLSDQPESRRVVVINERFARSTFGERNPIGQILTIRDEFRSGDDLEIVGVVGDVVQARVEDGMLPAVYVPHTQMASMLNVVVRSARGAESLASEIRRALAGGSLANAPVVGLSSMSERIAATLSAPRFQVLLIGAFAGAAILLGAIGIYATLAFTVRSRTRELGIRMAMGASQRQIFELVLRQGITVLIAGCGVGVLGAVGLTRLLRGFLYRVSPIDPTAFAVALVVIAVTVMIAALRPAGRAAQVDPIASMRAEN